MRAELHIAKLKLIHDAPDANSDRGPSMEASDHAFAIHSPTLTISLAGAPLCEYGS
jgi:hypothetical protein